MSVILFCTIDDIHVRSPCLPLFWHSNLRWNHGLVILMYSRCISVLQTQTVSNKNVMVRVCTLCDVNKDEQILSLLEEANVTKIKHAD